MKSISMVKVIASCLLILLAFNKNLAQNPQYRSYLGTNANGLHQYGGSTNFPLNLVADDFGPRQLIRSTGPDPYDWHGGIDYNSPPTSQLIQDTEAGDLILSIESGYVS